MKKILSSAIAFLALTAFGQETRQNTFVYEGNPLVRDKYTADPAPVVASDGRLYLICGHDECFEDRPGYEGKYGFNITEWLCYSTEDMVTWTDHGVIMKPTDFSWSVGEAWASQVVEGPDGKFYFFVSTQCGDPDCKAVGVAVADKIDGPYVDAIGRPLIVDSMTDNGPRGWWNDFDPTVMIDDDGTPWMSWGNGTCFLVKLKRNMVELDGEIMVLPMENYVEGPWLYKRNGRYYNVYASMGDPLETISYAMADDVEGPWTFMGELTGMAKDSFTIHPGVIDYKGKTYLFYHNSTLSLDGYGPATGRRSVCVDEMFYNADGTIRPVVQTKAGYSPDAKENLVEKHPALAPYFSVPSEEAIKPDEQGFIRRWLLLEPISLPNRTNTVFVDSYVREHLDTDWNKDGFTLPEDAKDGWHALDSKLFNVKLYRFAVGTDTGRYGMICRAVTVIDVPEDIENVRLAAGSNSASMWWIDSEEVLILSGDRRMVMDDGASERLTLKKGRHVLACSVINGPGMSDFCVRFIDEKGNPVLNYDILNK